MDTILLLIRVALAAMFVLAGISKLLDLPGSRKAMRDFGVPEPYAGYAGVALPVAELAIAVLLIPRVTAWWGALAALLLLLAFIGGMANVMRQGKAPDCHCFGQVHSEPVGWQTIARNGVFAALALIVVAQGPSDAGPGPVGWWERQSDSSQVALGLGAVGIALFALQGWFLFRLVQQNGQLLVKLDELEALGTGQATATQAHAPNSGLTPGTAAPGFRLADLDGETHTLQSLLAPGKPLLLVFTDANCGPCAALTPTLAKWQRDLAADLTIAAVARGDLETLRAKSAPHGLTRVLVQEDREVATAYNSLATPSAVLVQPDGTIGSAPALGGDAIGRLVTQLNAPPPPPRPEAIPVGSPAPDFSLTDLDGAERSLSEFRGEDVLVAFWNPGCGFCARMLLELTAWERDRPEGAPRLLVVSRGDVEANRQLGFTSPVLIDDEGAVMRQYGAAGTPAGVLVNAGGNVASALALGAPEVMRIARGAAVA